MRHGKRFLLVAISLSAVLAGSTVAAYGSPSGSPSFRPSGLRSHGLPTFGAGGTSPLSAPAVGRPSIANGDSTADRNWESARKQPGGERDKHAFGTLSTNPIIFNGGSVYTGKIAVYPVWVGAWTQERQEHWNEILSNLITSIPSHGSIDSPNQIFATDSLYFSLLKQKSPTLDWPLEETSAPVTLPGTGVIQVSDDDVVTYINQAITQGLVPSPDAAAAAGYKAVYVYIGAKNTFLSSGFGTLYCGYHGYGDYGTSSVPYIVMQDFTNDYLPQCAYPTNHVASPSGDPVADAVANIFAHELSESITDPYLDAWFDNYGSENADKCAWTFGETKKGSSEAGTYTYNLVAGHYRYLIQRNWMADNIVREVVNGVDNACSLTGSRQD